MAHSKGEGAPPPPTPTPAPFTPAPPPHAPPSCVKLETDFEQSIDEIAATQKQQQQHTHPHHSHSHMRIVSNGPSGRSGSGSGSKRSDTTTTNGYPSKRKKPKSSHWDRDHDHLDSIVNVNVNVKGGKNLDMLHRKIKGGKPFSHQMSQVPLRRGKPSLSKVTVLEIPKSGKPRSMMGMCSSASKKKQNAKKAAAAAAAAVETYHSQISEDTNTIKIKIRKASSQQLQVTEVLPVTKKAVVSDGKRKRNISPVSCSSSGEEYDPSTATVIPTAKPRAQRPRPIRPHNHAKNTHGKAAKSQAEAPSLVAVRSEVPPVKIRSSTVTQNRWGCNIPEELLTTVFKHVVAAKGALPALVKLGEVCKLWHSASMTPALWGAVELSHYTRDKWKTDHRLVWLLENRLSMCHQLNLSNWKVSNLAWVISCIVEFSPKIQELNLSGWKRLTCDQLKEITLGLTELSRLDLSCTSETGSSGSCLSVTSLTHMAQTMGQRLTHLTLASNKLTGLPSILAAIANHCSNLELLDLSNLAAVSHPALVPLERLQKGCPRLRVLRITNSQVVLASATTQEQVESPGFPLLEELSVACPSTDYKLVDDEVLGRLLKTSNCLRLLDVRGCIRITDSGLIKVPAWDLQHLFLSGCCVTRQSSSCLELICEKWSHSLLEVDLAWSTATQPLDAAVEALAEKGENSMLRILNLCGSSVSFDPVKTILLKCPHLESVNLSSCRALPRGMKRLYTGKELGDLRDSLDPVKKKLKEESERLAKEAKKKAQEESKRKQEAKNKEDSNSIIKSPLKDVDLKSPKDDSIVSESEKDEASMKSPLSALSSPALTQATTSVRSVEQEDSPQCITPQISPAPNKGSTSFHEQFSPQQCSSAISTPRSNHVQDYSPAPRPMNSEAVSASNQYDSDSRQEAMKNSGPWNLGQFSPMTKQDGPTSSHPSPDTGNSVKQDIQKPAGSWNFSPSVARQENSPYSSQQSPYPSQTSPDMGHSVSKTNQHGQSGWNLEKFSPALRQESACSSQPSPETGHVASRSGQGNWNLERFSPMPSSAMLPSPDTSQVTSSGKSCGQWNLDRFSPMARAESSPAAIPSPETGTSNVKSGHWNIGHFSPMARPEMSPAAQPSPETTGQVPKSNWNIGHFSPMTRQEVSPVGQQPSPGGVQSTVKMAPSGWNLGQFSPMSKVDSSSGAQRSVQSDATPNMWDVVNAQYSLHDVSGKNDAERTGSCFGNIDQVTTTTYCSGSSQVMYTGYSDPLNGPSSVE
ncbi:F-box and leucine-rich repeat protein 6 [Arctopsyche grandis]|uniref:F-box and leucine-rich repeat protein 6 n=1 Tax=Arctopsyche grandis TaxID=121162 RepID=UPI00406D68B9